MLKLEEEKKTNNSFNLDGDIIFSNVDILVEEKALLKNLNFVVKKGEKVAIIGENGSGKSLLSKAILKFTDYTGNIYINNHNIKRESKHNIREYVELVEGNQYLFKGTILENIVIKNNRDYSSFKNAIKDSELYEDIKRFKEKENTLVGESGDKLSGGQRQRIAIARALVSEKPIVLFDEALNKIDNNTKEKILKNLISKYKERTMVFITHDLKILDYVDRIIHINNNTAIVKENIGSKI